MEPWVISAFITTLVVVGCLGVDLPNAGQVQLNIPFFKVFNQYTTEMYQSALIGHGAYIRKVVFEPYSWYFESGFKDNVSYSYTYKNGYTDYSVTCQRIGDHDNCYVINDKLGDGQLIFKKSYLFKTIVTCPSIRDPLTVSKKRQLDKCYYSHVTLDNRGSYKEIWLETETYYPVKIIEVEVTQKLTEEWSILEFCSFETEVPSNKSKLSPVKGVTVYDFRNGKDGVFNENEEENGLNTTVPNDEKEMFHMVFNKFNSFAGPSMGPSPIYKMSTRDTIPKSFDARDKWSNCSVIKQITNQQSCGSCWAMASSAVLADRTCIYTNGNVDLALSPQFMINCFPNQDGCDGGKSAGAWQNLMEVGTVPDKCVSFKAEDGICTGSCDDGSSMPKATKAKNIYSPWGGTDKERVEAIQREIMEHGPVSACFRVFTDWKPQHWSIYHRSPTAVLEDGHCVRIIGWGTEYDEDYWLIANSHGKGFKDGGVFKMSRGNNECNIEEEVFASEPLLG